MQRVSVQILFGVLAALVAFGGLSIAWGQDVQAVEGRTISNALPPGFSDLVPPGYELQSPQLVRYGSMGSLEFYAKKDIAGRRDVYYSEYRFELTIMEKAAQLIRLQGKAYLAQLENDITSKMTPRESDAVTAFDDPQLTRYPWGAGITRRVVHKYMGAGTGPDEIEYRCEYLGVIVGDHSIKKFNLSVSGVDTAEEADQWEKKTVDKITKTSLSNMGD